MSMMKLSELRRELRLLSDEVAELQSDKLGPLAPSRPARLQAIRDKLGRLYNVTGDGVENDFCEV